MLAFAKGVVKKVLVCLETGWQSQREQLKNVGKLKNVSPFPESCQKSDGKHRNVMEFAEGAVKKVLTGLEMCWHSHKEQFKKC